MPDKSASLYTRLGGYDAIAAVVDDLLPRLRSDELLSRFWVSPRSVDTHVSIAAGGSQSFVIALDPGRDIPAQCFRAPA
jgi:hypothetical protein